MPKSEEFERLPETNFKPEKEVKKNTRNKLIQVINFLKKNYDFRYNVVTTEIEYKKKNQELFRMFDERAYHDTLLVLKLEGFTISEVNFKNIINSDFVPEFDPFKDYVLGLRNWDGTDHIKQFLDQVYLSDETNREYFVECFKKWFVALVASLVKDEVVNHTCFVLVGKQGRYKTTFLNSIVPLQMRLDYLYTSAFQTHNKDHELFLASKMLINLDEMATLNRTDIESLKSRMSQDRVVVRKPYGRECVKLWRRASFCGSINREQFINDATGSRRFLPFKIEDIKLDPDFDISLIYSQAFALFQSGYTFYFDQASQGSLETHNEMYRERGMEEEMILKHFSKPSAEELKSGANFDYMTTTEIMTWLCDKYPRLNQNNSVLRNIGVVLQKEGFERAQRRRKDGGSSSPAMHWKVKLIPGIIEATYEDEIRSDENLI